MNRASWLIPLFLLFGIFAPTACVLWFMNAAARSQGAAARQSVTDAWRGQLRSLRDRADSFWLDRAAAIGAAATGSDAQTFRRIVQQGLADSVVLPYYPLPARETFPTIPAHPDWRSASGLEHTPGKLRDAAAQYGRIAASEGDPELAARAAQAQHTLPGTKRRQRRRTAGHSTILFEGHGWPFRKSFRDGR